MKTAWAFWPQTVGDTEQFNTVIQEYRQITVTDIANKLDVICGSAYTIIHEDLLGYQKICARWMPKQLTVSTNGHIRKCVCSFYSDITKKERFFCNGLSQVMKHGCTIMNLPAILEHWVETYHPGPRNSEVCLLPVKWCWHCCRILMGPSSSTTCFIDIQSVVHSIVLCLERSWNPMLA